MSSNLRPIHPVAPSSSAVAASDAFDGERLRQGRLLALMTKQGLADTVEVSPASIGQYESGVISPRPEVVERLARALDVPPKFFAAGRPFAHLDAADAHFRSLRSTSVGQRAKALAWTEQVWELVHALEKRIRLPEVDLPAVPPGAQLTATPHLAAQALRDHWGLGRTPVAHLTRAVESRGIVVVLATFADIEETKRISAFSTGKLSRPIIVTPPDRADDVHDHRFNVAHELGHLLMHEDQAHGDLQIEREANQFAAELLLPEAVMRTILPPRIDWSRLARLSTEWGVSVKSLVYRGQELGIYSEPTARRAYIRYQMLLNEGHFPPQPIGQFEGEVPILLTRAYAYAEQLGITVRDLAEELGWRPARVRELLGDNDPRPVLTLA